ncbi:substrate-binding domain-containing protein [Bacteroides sp. CR5/BHMF/2]|nr:substrate-binding domain-containing protein [Bacteroides sp. CR5/BHMF/2]
MVIEMPYGHKNAVKVSTNVYLLMVSAVTFMYIRINHWMTYGFMNLPLLTWLKSLPKPTALMACDDNQGNRITEVCREQYQSAGQNSDIRVDNDDIICNLSEPPLSSINHNIVRGGF